MAVPNFFEMRRYKAPPLRVTVAARPGFASNWRTFGARVTGPNGSAGRTNGMPWDGTSPVSAAAEIDSYKNKKSQAQTMKARAAIIRGNQNA